MPKDLPDWTKAYLLQGQNAAGDPVTILLTDTGQMAAILQGMGDTGLTTIAVDENGRLQVFVLDDESQWGQTIVVGNAELASRLGSVVAWDWRGKVIEVCDFSQGIPHNSIGLSGTGASVECTGEYQVYGGFSAKLTAGSDASEYASIGGVIGPNPSERIGLACRFSCVGPPLFLYLNITAQTGTHAYRGRVQLDFTNDEVEYWDSGGVWQVAGSLELYQAAHAFHSFKLVVDGSTGKYVRVMVNDTEIDLSAFDLLDLGTVFTPAIGFTIHNTGRTAQNDVVYVDSFCLTVAEP